MKQSFKEFSVGLEELDINEKLSMYNDYEYNYIQENVTINLLEIASILADDEIERRQKIALECGSCSPYPLLSNGIMQEVYGDDGKTVLEVRYTEEAQELFNELYSAYLLKLKEISTK